MLFRSHVYDEDISGAIERVAEENEIELKQGVYIQLSGPQYETPAEVRMCRLVGADAVGMSTACEAIAARHMGLKVCGISCISNLAAGMSDKALAHAEVVEVTNRVEEKFTLLVSKAIAAIGAGIR